MMRSLSTSAFGHPRETNEIFGGDGAFMAVDCHARLSGASRAAGRALDARRHSRQSGGPAHLAAATKPMRLDWINLRHRIEYALFCFAAALFSTLSVETSSNLSGKLWRLVAPRLRRHRRHNHRVRRIRRQCRVMMKNGPEFPSPISV